MKKKALSIALLIAIGMTQVHATVNSLTIDDRKSGKKNEPVVRNILSDKLPAKLLTTIRKDYKTYWITDLHRSTANGKTTYHITVENPDKIVQLSANQPTGWTITSVVPK